MLRECVPCWIRLVGYGRAKAAGSIRDTFRWVTDAAAYSASATNSRVCARPAGESFGSDS